MIALNNVTKKFKNSDNEIALKNITTTFEEGFIHGIIGLSGAGKSTLIRLLNKLEHCDSGIINIFDYTDLKIINKESTRMLRKRVGMVFQSDHLLSRKTVLDNILFPIKLQRKLCDDDYKFAQELINDTGLNGYENRYPSQLSGGQRQRVGIARVLITKPDVLLCDEPTSALDVITTSQILSLIESLSKKHEVTVLLVTHDMNVVKAICDTVTVMHKGEIVEQGSVEDIIYMAKHPQTKEFIKGIGIDLSTIVNETNKDNILLLTFDESTVYKPIISTLIMELKTKIRIVYANISPNNNGVLLLEVENNKKEIISFLRKQKVVVKDVV